MYKGQEHVRAPVMGKLQGLDRAAGITGKADADDHILRPNAQELFEHLAGGGRMDDRDIIKDQVKICLLYTS